MDVAATRTWPPHRDPGVCRARGPWPCRPAPAASSPREEGSRPSRPGTGTRSSSCLVRSEGVLGWLWALFRMGTKALGKGGQRPGPGTGPRATDAGIWPSGPQRCRPSWPAPDWLAPSGSLKSNGSSPAHRRSLPLFPVPRCSTLITHPAVRLNLESSPPQPPPGDDGDDFPSQWSTAHIGDRPPTPVSSRERRPRQRAWPDRAADSAMAIAMGWRKPSAIAGSSAPAVMVGIFVASGGLLFGYDTGYAGERPRPAATGR